MNNKIIKKDSRARRFDVAGFLGGFTIIELLVTISIMSLLTVIMIPALRSFDRRNKVEAAAEQFKSAITEARNYSMSPRFSDSDIDRYAVKITNITSDPVLYEVGYCKTAGAAGVCDALNWQTILEKRLPMGVIVDSHQTGETVPFVFTEIGFKVPDSRVIYDGNVTEIGDGSVVLKAKNNMDSKTVVINGSTGLISLH